MGKGGGTVTSKRAKSGVFNKNPSIAVLGDVAVGNNLEESRPSETHLSDKQEGEGDNEAPPALTENQLADGAQTPDIVVQGSDKHPKRRSRGRGRFIFKNLWEVCCNETEAEIKEVDGILHQVGLPAVNYSKKKSYDIKDYDVAPDLTSCQSKDFLDFYVFPYLLPAIQALIQFARVNRVFQCRFCTFNAIDYLVEYLYNNNPRYPERVLNPLPIYEIPFCKEWLEKHPRTPPPNWMLMSSEDAAVIIQRVVRGYMVRCRPEVQEMRQFWKDYRKDVAGERTIYNLDQKLSKETIQQLIEPYEPEIYGELADQAYDPQTDAPLFTLEVGHHSDTCIYCEAFRNFLATQPEEIIKSYARVIATVDVTDVDQGSEKRGSAADSATGRGDNPSQNGGDNTKGDTDSAAEQLKPPTTPTDNLSAVVKSKNGQ